MDWIAWSGVAEVALFAALGIAHRLWGPDLGLSGPDVDQLRQEVKAKRAALLDGERRNDVQRPEVEKILRHCPPPMDVLGQLGEWTERPESARVVRLREEEAARWAAAMEREHLDPVPRSDVVKILRRQMPHDGAHGR